MNNHDIFWKVADRIRDTYRDHVKGEEAYACSEDAARELQDAGLLAPDIPEPNFATEHETEWDTIDGYVNVENGLITVSHDERTEDDTPEEQQRLDADPGEIIITSPDEAEYLGHLIIAAANHAEVTRNE